MNPHSSPGRWVRRFHDATPDRPVVVCFPHAGGSASFFQPFSAHCRPHAEVLAIQYPGRQDRFADPPLTSITALAEAVVAELGDWLHRPLVLFGHSMGATVAFEVARRLAVPALGTPRALVASSRIAPSRRQTRTPRLDERGILDELRRLRGGPVTIDDDVLELALPALRSDFAAVAAYRCPPQRKVHCPVTVFVGAEDNSVTAEDSGAWARHTSGRFELRTFPGGHHYLEDQWAPVAAAVLEVTGLTPSEPMSRRARP